MKQRKRSDFLGAFADAAVLFPILAALSTESGFSGVRLMAGAGLAYLVAGFLFHVPMPVQPLKSIAIAGLAAGAQSLEIRVAGAILGLFCLCLLVVPKLEEKARHVPLALIHAVQLGLGVLLIIQALRTVGTASLPLLLSAAAIAMLLVAWTSASAFPALGLAATLALAYAIALSFGSGLPLGGGHAGSGVRWPLVLYLTAPQMVLTLANSVFGTREAAARYYGEAARRVTVVRLLASIGAGNLAASAFGALPYCHGSGGVTAHYRGGAGTAAANVWIGGFLLLGAALQAWAGSGPIRIPAWAIAALLAATGVMHVGLAESTWKKASGKPVLAVAAAATMLGQNLLLTLVAALAAYVAAQALGRPATGGNRA